MAIQTVDSSGKIVTALLGIRNQMQGGQTSQAKSNALWLRNELNKMKLTETNKELQARTSELNKAVAARQKAQNDLSLAQYKNLETQTNLQLDHLAETYARDVKHRGETDKLNRELDAAQNAPGYQAMLGRQQIIGFLQEKIDAGEELSADEQSLYMAARMVQAGISEQTVIQQQRGQLIQMQQALNARAADPDNPLTPVERAKKFVVDMALSGQLHNISPDTLDMYFGWNTKQFGIDRATRRILAIEKSLEKDEENKQASSTVPTQASPQAGTVTPTGTPPTTAPPPVPQAEPNVSPTPGTPSDGTATGFEKEMIRDSIPDTSSGAKRMWERSPLPPLPKYPAEMTKQGETSGQHRGTVYPDPVKGVNVGYGRSLTHSGMDIRYEVIPFIQDELRAQGITDPKEIEAEVKKRFKAAGLSGKVSRERLNPEQFKALFPKGLTEAQADKLLENDFVKSEGALKRILGEDVYSGLSRTQQHSLLDMIHTLGETGFSEFKKMIGHIKAGEFDKAAGEMKNSDWYKQVKPRRGDPIIAGMLKGVAPTSTPPPATTAPASTTAPAETTAEPEKPAPTPPAQAPKGMSSWQRQILLEQAGGLQDHIEELRKQQDFGKDNYAEIVKAQTAEKQMASDQITAQGRAISSTKPGKMSEYNQFPADNKNRIDPETPHPVIDSMDLSAFVKNIERWRPDKHIGGVDFSSNDPAVKTEKFGAAHEFLNSFIQQLATRGYTPQDAQRILSDLEGRVNTLRGLGSFNKESERPSKAMAIYHTYANIRRYTPEVLEAFKEGLNTYARLQEGRAQQGFQRGMNPSQVKMSMWHGFEGWFDPKTLLPDAKEPSTTPAEKAPAKPKEEAGIAKGDTLRRFNSKSKRFENVSVEQIVRDSKGKVTSVITKGGKRLSAKEMKGYLSTGQNIPVHKSLVSKLPPGTGVIINGTQYTIHRVGKGYGSDSFRSASKLEVLNEAGEIVEFKEGGFALKGPEVFLPNTLSTAQINRLLAGEKPNRQQKTNPFVSNAAQSSNGGQKKNKGTVSSTLTWETLKGGDRIVRLDKEGRAFASVLNLRKPGQKSGGGSVKPGFYDGDTIMGIEVELPDIDYDQLPDEMIELEGGKRVPLPEVWKSQKYTAGKRGRIYSKDTSIRLAGYQAEEIYLKNSSKLNPKGVAAQKALVNMFSQGWIDKKETNRFIFKVRVAGIPHGHEKASAKKYKNPYQSYDRIVTDVFVAVGGVEKPIGQIQWVNPVKSLTLGGFGKKWSP